MVVGGGVVADPADCPFTGDLPPSPNNYDPHSPSPVHVPRPDDATAPDESPLPECLRELVAQGIDITATFRTDRSSGNNGSPARRIPFFDAEPAPLRKQGVQHASGYGGGGAGQVGSAFKTGNPRSSGVSVGYGAHSLPVPTGYGMAQAGLGRRDLSGDAGRGGQYPAFRGGRGDGGAGSRAREYRGGAVFDRGGNSSRGDGARGGRRGHGWGVRVPARAVRGGLPHLLVEPNPVVGGLRDSNGGLFRDQDLVRAGEAVRQDCAEVLSYLGDQRGGRGRAVVRVIEPSRVFQARARSPPGAVRLQQTRIDVAESLEASQCPSDQSPSLGQVADLISQEVASLGPLSNAINVGPQLGLGWKTVEVTLADIVLANPSEWNCAPDLETPHVPFFRPDNEQRSKAGGCPRRFPHWVVHGNLGSLSFRFRKSCPVRF